MRSLGIAAVLITMMSASMGVDAGVARRQYCEDLYQNVYLAARQAVHDVGARVVHSDEGSGSVVGRIEAEVYGQTIEISVWITRERFRENRSGEPMWVQVQAKLKKVKDPDPERLEQLEMIESQVFDFIRRRALCGPPS